MFDLIEIVAVAAAIIAVGFSVIWVVLGYKSMRLGSRYLSMKEESDSAKAIEILKRRYAKGEITKQQYETMMQELEQHP